MLKSKAQNKTATPPITKIKSKKTTKSADSKEGEDSTSTITSRVEQLALPPIRTLMQNQEQYKHILTERGAGVLEQKIKQTMFSRYGRSQDPYGPDTIIESTPIPKYVRQDAVNKKPVFKPISESKTPLAPSRIELLAKPLKRRLPSAVSNISETEVCNVKPSTLNYVANERILELSQPKKINHKVAQKKSFSKYKSFKRP